MGVSMLVVRDYTCRMAVDARLMERAVVAAIKEYPEKYVHFIAQFVDATMGGSMQKFFRKMETLYNQVFDASMTPFMNVMAWKMYGLLTRQHGTDTAARDTTMRTLTERKSAFDDSEISGSITASSCSAIDFNECFNDHTSTYRDLARMCAGFGTTDLHARALLEVCNMYGRQWCEDTLLTDDNNQVDYAKVVLKVPMSFAVDKSNNIPNIGEFEANLGV